MNTDIDDSTLLDQLERLSEELQSRGYLRSQSLLLVERRHNVQNVFEDAATGVRSLVVVKDPKTAARLKAMARSFSHPLIERNVSVMHVGEPHYRYAGCEFDRVYFDDASSLATDTGGFALACSRGTR